MTFDEFEQVAQEEFDALPVVLQKKIDNVHIVIENLPGEETLRNTGYRAGSLLLGLYEGVPLSKRGIGYGMYPVTPDKITLFKANIERVARTESAVRKEIRDTLIHEIAHYYGLSEEEIRSAGF
jgi:predicted Zn-dependent protease with MMP-like domain